MTLKHLSVAGLALLFAPFTALAQSNGLSLLECVGSVCQIPTNTGPLGAFGIYFNLLYPWVVGMGAAVAVLMGVIGGIQIMLAGADQGKRSAGINRFMISIGGLLLILFSATILHALNPVFFK